MKYNETVGNINIKLDSSRMDGNIRNAQKLLNMQIVADCDEYIPFQQGALRGSVNYPDGIYGDCIEYNTPYAHYQYVGELYLSENGSSWAKKYEKKNPSGVHLNYHHNGTGDHWFEKAKQVHERQWIDLVKREAGKG